MGWQTDQPPLEYLKRRIVYYKKKRPHFKKHYSDSFLIKEYGGKMKLKKLLDEAVVNLENRIKEFEDAVSILSVEKLKRMRTNK